MTRRTTLQKWMRDRGRRRAAARMSGGMPAHRSAPRRQKSAECVLSRRLVQSSVCGVLFALLVVLKLVLPGNLAAFRGTLAQWLVRDADFVSAFSAIGHAAAAPQRFAESLGEAYIAVFGDEQAQEVGGRAELKETETAARELPEHASAEHPALPFSYAPPLAGTLTSSFGWREDPNGGAEAFHYGVDLAADEGTDFVCFAGGTVGVVGESTVLGKYLTVRHDGGFETLYAHCSRITVGPDQSVTMGEVLGEVGATGNATGAHLHFELHNGASYLDPIGYLTDAA